MDYREYLKERIKEFNLFDGWLKEKGVILYNLGYGKENPGLPIELLYRIMFDGWSIVDQITWKKKTAIPFQSSSRFLSRICEQIYVICRMSERFSFITNKQVSKVNEKTKQKFYKNYLNYIEAANNDGVDNNHKASYSTELVLKLMDIYVKEGSVVGDPYMGRGTTGKACVIKGCSFIGIEKEEVHYNKAVENINRVIKEKEEGLYGFQL